MCVKKKKVNFKIYKNLGIRGCKKYKGHENHVLFLWYPLQMLSKIEAEPLGIS